MFYFNYACTHINKQGVTPFKDMYGKEYDGVLLVFGCEIQFVLPETERDKFESRSRKGAFMMYGRCGGIHVLDFETFKSEGKFRTVHTRNYTANREVMPLREICRDWTEAKASELVMHSASSDLVEGETYIDPSGVLRCSICDLVSTEAPVTCSKCLGRKKHGRGRPTVDCRRGRCKGHIIEDEQGVPDCDDPTGTTVGETTVDGSIGDAAQPAANANAPTNAAPPGPIAPATLFVPQIILAKGEVKPKASNKKSLYKSMRAEKARDHDLDATHFEEIQKIKRAIGYLTRVHQANSKAAKESIDAKIAVQEEFKQFEKTGTLHPREVYEKADVLRDHPDARFVEFMMLVGEKNIEHPARYKWKARGVALGNKLRNRYGAIIEEQLLHAVSAGMEGLRLGFGWGLITGSRGRRGDAKGAYLQADLSGAPVFVVISDDILRDGWTKGGTRYTQPVRRVWKPLYGLQRGNTDWGRKVRKVLTTELNATWIGDHGEDSLYMFKRNAKYPALIIVYSDDFHVVGPEEEEAYAFLAPRLQFGMRIIVLQRYGDKDPEGRSRVVLHQTKYAKHILTNFEKAYNQGGHLHPATTPVVAVEKKGAREQDGLVIEEEVPVPDWIPDFTTAKEHLAGEIGWLVRGSRPDLGIPYRKVSSRLHCWKRQDDHMMYRIFQYLRKTVGLGMAFVYDPRDLPEGFIVKLRTDADHAGDIESAKSTSGGRVALEAAWGPYLPISWWARKQSYTARSTPEAEIIALDEGTFLHAAPIAGVMGGLLSKDVRAVAEIDASVGISTVARGFSRRMAYLRKTRRVSMSALYGCYYGDQPEAEQATDASTYNRLTHLPGDDNDADLMTKPFDAQGHWMLCNLIDMVTIPADA